MIPFYSLLFLSKSSNYQNMRKIVVPVIILFSMGISTSCLDNDIRADLIVHNAQIYIVDDNSGTASAMAIKDGKILAAGSEEEILRNYTSLEIIDMQGAYIYPGFNDAHCHFYGYGLGLLERADLRETGSFEEVLDIIREHYVNHPSEWIEGRGWDQNDWEDKSFPDKGKLDMLFPDVPVILTRIDGHAALVNSEALRRAGIDRRTKVKGGEVILKDGEPSGILIDNAIELVKSVIPETDLQQQKEGLLLAEKNCFAAGLTSVTDAGLDWRVIRLIDSLQENGELRIRVNAMLSPSDKDFEKALDNGIFNTGKLQVNSIKLYADGALGSRGAAMIEPYSDDPGNFGLILHPDSFYHTVCKNAYELGFQVNTHAIGDRGNRMILDIYSQYLKGSNDRRWRIEHAQVVHPDDFSKFGRFNIIPSIQATHATSDMYWAETRIGPERIPYAYAYQDLLEQNGWLPNGTDFPIEKIEPLLTFYASIARKDIDGWPYEGFQKENALTREQALKSITIWPAKASFEENLKGSLEPGKFADFVILEKDLMTIPENEIPSIKILGTYIGGEKVHPLTD